MDDETLNKLLHEALHLGVMATLQLHDVKSPASEHIKLYDLLRSVAKGEATLMNSPDEMRLKYPDRSPELERMLQKHHLVVAQQREMAQRVLDGFPK